jgi:UDP-4-amino-4,6-dideoxy-N-acetyl-beta-L-altrosamine N-acetyltransferase
VIELVQLQEDDLKTVMRWRMHPEVTKYMYSDPVLSLEGQKQWFQQINQAGDQYFTIADEGRKVGVVSLTNIRKNFAASWAFYLDPDMPQGRGVGSQVELKVIDHVFYELHLHKLNCEVFVFNDKVIKMHEKFGFRREAYYRDFVIKNEQAYDVVGLALLKKDWENGLRHAAIARLESRR